MDGHACRAQTSNESRAAASGGANKRQRGGGGSYWGLASTRTTLSRLNRRLKYKIFTPKYLIFNP